MRTHTHLLEKKCRAEREEEEEVDEKKRNESMRRGRRKKGFGGELELQKKGSNEKLNALFFAANLPWWYA